jgi:hypothetical protein
VVLCLAVALFALSTVASAQSQGTGQIVGTVYDQSGAAMPNAKVIATSKATGLVRDAETNTEGGYRIVLLPPGTYSVEVKQQGFKAFKSEITVNVGAAVTVDARLQVGQVTEVVEVVATAVIETTAVQTDALINQKSIAGLPINGRRFQDFVQLTPTVQIEPSRSGISFAGQRGINANITIDGADYNQPFFGGIRGGERANSIFTIPQESISEFQIVPYGYSAEFGRSTAGVMNAVTKSGTNEWHGSGFYYNRDKSMSRKDPFNRTTLDSQHQFGGSFGGAVRKDKSFFFVSGEDQLVSNPRNVVFRNLDTTPRTAFNGEGFDFYRGNSGQEVPFTRTNDGWTVLGRWDEQFSSNHRVGVRYHYSTNTAKNDVSTGGSILPETNESLSDNGIEGDKQYTVAGQWTGIFSPHVVNEFRSEYSHESRPRQSNSMIPNITNAIGTTGLRFFLPTTEFDWRLQVADNLSWNIGTHGVKFGGEYNHLFASQFFKQNQVGLFSMGGSNIDLLLNIMSVGTGGCAPPLTCTDPVHRFDDAGNTVYRLNIGNGLADMAMEQLSLFITDAWRITPRFTLTYGFRWEGYFNPTPATTNSALTASVVNTTFPCCGKINPGVMPDNIKQFMPRLGIAWDMTGNGKTVLRANAGLYYATSPLLLFATPLNNFRTPPGDLSVQMPFSGAPATCPAAPPGSPAGLTLTGSSRYCASIYGQFLWANGAAGPALDLDTKSLGSLPTLTPAQLQNIAVGLGLPFDPNQGVQPLTWANNYESPRSWQWNIAMEREIARGLTVGGDFVYINTAHLQRNRDWNLPSPVVFAGTTRTVTIGGNTINVIFPADASQRPCFGLRAGSACTPTGTVTLTNTAVTPNVVIGTATASVPLLTRPIPTLGSVQVRESSARAFYRAATARVTYRRKQYQLQGYYTFSKNLSDDDNERDSGGQGASNAFNFVPDYGYSRLDAKHLFVFNSVVNLRWDFTVSGLLKLRSGRPVDALTGNVTPFASNVTFSGLPAGTSAAFAAGSQTNDPNGDLFTTDRPFSARGVSYIRNAFRDRAVYSADLRVAKAFKLPREGMRVDITVDFFNLFNFDNVTFGSTLKNFGNGISANNAAVLTPSSTFQQLYNPANCLSATNTTGNKACYDTRNTPPGYPVGPFLMQVGVRFQF